MGLFNAIPRYEREYSLGDLAAALRGVTNNAISESFLPSLPAESTSYSLASGKEALCFLLKAFELEPGAKVGVPLYCCPAVFEAVRAARCQPVFLDVEPEHYGLDLSALRRHRNELRAVVAVHLFGIPDDLDAIRDVVGGDVVIIEDCAQSLFSRYKGRFTGLVGDASIFSFGVHKPASVGGGGLAIVNRNQAVPAADRFYQSLDEAPLRDQLLRCIRTYLRSIGYSQPVYSVLKSVVKKRRESAVREVEPDSGDWVLRRMGRTESALIAPHMTAFESSLETLRRNVALLRQELAEIDVHIPLEPSWGSWNHFLLPLRFRSPELRERADVLLAEQGIDSGPIYPRCVRFAAQYGYRGDCDRAERVVTTTTILPHYAGLGLDDLERAASAIRGFDQGAARPSKANASAGPA